MYEYSLTKLSSQEFNGEFYLKNLLEIFNNYTQII